MFLWVYLSIHFEVNLRLTKGKKILELFNDTVNFLKHFGTFLYHKAL
jgi:hypothetical protein